MGEERERESSQRWFVWRRVLQVNVSEMEEDKAKCNPMQSMKACGGAEVELYSFLISALGGSV